MSAITINGRNANPFVIGFLGMLGAGLAYGLFHLVDDLAGVIVCIACALFLALGLEPVIRFLNNRGIKRGWAVTITSLAVVIVAAGVLLLVVPPVVRQVQQFIGDIPRIIDDIMRQSWFAKLEENLPFGIDLNESLENAGAWASNPANLASIGGGFLTIGAGVLTFTTNVIIVIILTLYFAAGLPRIKSAFYRLMPARKREGIEDVTEEITSSVGRYILGQSALAATNGALSAVFLTIIGAPLPALLAFIAFLGSLIPLVGTISASCVIVVSCLMSSPTLAIIAAIYYLVYMQIEAYVFNPRIMKAVTDVPGPIVIIAAIAGATLGGVLGAIASIPVAASLLIIYRRVVVPRQDAKH